MMLAHTDGEMFVSRDYNYNHSVLLKLNSVVFDCPACWNQFTVLLRIPPTQSQEVKVAGTLMRNLIPRPGVDTGDKAADWPEPAEPIFILACLRLEVMMPTAARD